MLFDPSTLGFKFVLSQSTKSVHYFQLDIIIHIIQYSGYPEEIKLTNL